MSIAKPTPDELLTHLEREESVAARGRLKIFLGYVSGVGKSFRMFDEGRRRRDRGQDVIVGAIQERNSPEIATLIQKLELIPPCNVAGIPVLDVHALLQRHPEVCLVDGLAHDNPAESPNRHRWQDVEELLRAGISVISTINLGFIAELRDEVAAVCGKRTESVVPIAFLKEADELVVVDAPAGHELTHLRETALLLAADVVDRQLERYLAKNGVASSLGAQERLLICVVGRSPMTRMLERARKMQERFHAPLFAVHVSAQENEDEQDGDLRGHLQAAREAGAEVHLLSGGDPVSAIIEFARANRITQIYIGHSSSQEWKLPFQRTIGDRIIQAAEGIDVRLFPN